MKCMRTLQAGLRILVDEVVVLALSFFFLDVFELPRAVGNPRRLLQNLSNALSQDRPPMEGQPEKPHVCSFCNRGFRKPEHLQRHTRIRDEASTAENLRSATKAQDRLHEPASHTPRTRDGGAARPIHIPDSGRTEQLEEDTTPISAACEHDSNVLHMDSHGGQQRQAPNVAPVSSQSRARYFKAFMRNSRFPLLHPIVRPEDLHPSLQNAAFALGALFLLEGRSANMLYAASRSFAARSLDARARTLDQSSYHIVDTFILLSEFIKLEQPINLLSELRFLQSGLSFWLRACRYPIAGEETPGNRSPAVSEMIRRSQTFGSCALISNGLFLGSHDLSWTAASRVRLSCPRRSWDRLDKEDANHETSPSMQAMAGTMFDELQARLQEHSPDTNAQHSLTSIELEHLWVMIGLAIVQIRIVNEASNIGSFKGMASSERESVAKMLQLLLNLLEDLPHPTSGNRGVQALLNSSASLIHLVSLHNITTFGFLDLDTIAMTSPSKLAATLKTGLKILPVSPETILTAVERCVNLLEDPADTGFVFFTRTRATGAIQSLLERVRISVSTAWSLVDDVNVEATQSSSVKLLARSISRFWARVFGALEHNAYAQLLGRTLEIYAEGLDSTLPSNPQADAGAS
ncbi:hypothetical protein CMUS01_08856 [Colletotrichum musicola]|uniref:C2H2-type domain-containing protein n=1 Tax=Colletotrichum musicola TaxID=2175873 RepID=A0A8H6KA01_9PEZI|nr:hypothetical protein CMUS01_08856 [Colletotrichum musicola]